MDKPGKLIFRVPAFDAYNIPEGYLARDAACHGLWYYYLIARKNYEKEVLDPIVYEGERDPEPNFKQLFSSIALAYGVQPEQMAHYWKHVDMQCWALHLPKLPDEEKYRFNTVPELRTQ